MGLVGKGHRRVLKPGLVEPDPFETGVDTDAMQGVDRVRGGVVDAGAAVEHQHAVADPGAPR